MAESAGLCARFAVAYGAEEQVDAGGVRQGCVGFVRQADLCIGAVHKKRPLLARAGMSVLSCSWTYSSAAERPISHNLRMACSIRQCSAADLARLLESAADPADARHHRERFLMQEAGLATYLAAWRGDEPAGRCTVLTASKYDKVRQLLGAFPEMNALEARPPGQGTGTKMIACAERTAREHGAAKIGLAVAVSNNGANRLYQRLGYHDWGHGLVPDQWDETDSADRVVKTNADPCHYLTKPIT